MKAFLIGGDRSGSGKTSISVAIAALLSRKNAVQTFKIGMDYIDPSYLTGVTGRPCRNLDTFVLTPDQIREIFCHASQNASIALVEGVRGLFEGAESVDDIGSTASVAKLLGLPVILVIDSRSITRSAAAILTGFKVFDPDVNIVGVILNNVRGEGHVRKATEAIKHFCNIPVIGAIPRLEDIDLTMRHLGLVPYEEGSPDQAFLTRVQSVIETIGSHLDLDLLLDLAADIEIPEYSGTLFSKEGDSKIKIAIARDEAFNFYYSDIFPILTSLGASIQNFSPIHDDLPDADGYILGGGYPEYFGRQLSDNTSMREEIARVCSEGTPVYAECGGLMYLCDQIRFSAEWQGLPCNTAYQMCGIFKGESVIPSRRVVTYVIGESLADTPFGAHPIRGHAFHYSDVRLSDDTKYGFILKRGIGISGSMDGAMVKNTIGSYTHLHPVQAKPLLDDFCKTCKNI